MNLGKGPIEGRATLDNAYRNIEALLKAAGLTGLRWRRDCEALEEEGRFAFFVALTSSRAFHVEIPGCTLKAMKAVTIDAPRIYLRERGDFWFAQAVRIIKEEHDEALEAQRQRERRT